MNDPTILVTDVDVPSIEQIDTARPFSRDSPTAQPTGKIDLLNWLLNDQKTLTAVEQFTHNREHGHIPTQSKYYQSLVPAAQPVDGEQYGFEVDLDRCSGCKACVTACHSLNGLDENEAWRDVGLLVGGTSTHPVMQHVTTACHHCLEPACMIACPVDAYEKNPVTGIVKHLDDQCFGCEYCTLACPYDVPKYNSQLGIVRKCDMCSDRLAHGEAPACVQACPHEAISIRIVKQERVIEDSEADVFLPAAPEPHITFPTTTYKTRRVFPRNLLPVDYHSVNVQHSHWPLILMLVLTQLSVGAFVAGMTLELFLTNEFSEAMRPLHSITAVLFGLVALGASTLHLGRPRFAYRAIIGLRHSWLSREIVAFGVFAAVAVSYALVNWFGPTIYTANSQSIAGWLVATTGLIGVYCSVKIYAFTQREFWNFTHTTIRFFSTTAMLGTAAVWLTLLLLTLRGNELSKQIIKQHGSSICQTLMAFAGIKLAFEAALFRHLTDRQTNQLKRSAMLMQGPLVSWTMARFALGILGGLVMPALLLPTLESSVIDVVFLTAVVGVLFLACLVGELLERTLFFAAVAAPRMPGSLRT